MLQNCDYLKPRENKQPAILAKVSILSSLLQARDILSHIPHSQAGLSPKDCPFKANLHLVSGSHPESREISAVAAAASIHPRCCDCRDKSITTSVQLGLSIPHRYKCGRLCLQRQCTWLSATRPSQFPTIFPMRLTGSGMSQL